MTPRGRMIMVERIAAGRPVAHVAAEMGVSRKTADKWWRRWLVEGDDGLEDRSSLSASVSASDAGASGATDRAVTAASQARAGPDFEHRGDPGINGASGVVPARDEPALVDGSTDGPGDPPHPHGPAGRARPRRCEKAWADPTGWWLASSWPRQRETPPCWLRLRALSDRRAQSPRVQRDPGQRAGRDLRWVLGSGSAVLCRPWRSRSKR